MQTLKMSVISLGILLAGFLAVAGDAPTISAVPKKLEPTTYQIRNQKYQELLRPQDANSATGTRLVLYAPEPWKCMTWRLQPAGESAFFVKNLFTAKTFAADANTNPLQLAVVQVPIKKDGTENPTWQFMELADGSYKISDAKSGQALTATKGESDQIKVTAEAWSNLPEQKWQLQPLDPKKLTM